MASKLAALILFCHYTVIFLPTIKSNNDSQLYDYLSFSRILKMSRVVVEGAKPQWWGLAHLGSRVHTQAQHCGLNACAPRTIHSSPNPQGEGI